MRALLVASLVAAGTLAGCAADDHAEDGPSSIEEARGTQLAAGAGAITGLLIDDRFRPLELVAEGQATGPFQREGFILVQQTGQRLRTNSDGEFFVLDLPPGRYTLRPSVAGHEGTPQSLDVRVGQFVEANVVVRRVIQLAPDTIITMDQTVMRSCSFQFLDGRYTSGKICFGDLSEDGASGWADYNLTAFMPDVYGVVLEYKFSEVADWEMWITPPNNLVSDMYERINFFDADYGRHSLVAGENGTSKWAGLPFDPSHFYVWPNKAELGHQETFESAPPPFDQLGMGLGVSLQYSARMVMHAFLGDNPEFGTYAVLA